ncbi:MAG: glycosyltransferase family 39 protein [Candidatus Moraniibacteriota bacterium]
MKTVNTGSPTFRKYATLFILTAVIGCNLFLGLTRIGSYSAVDEPYWTYGRISKFWTAVSEHKWRSTNINDKPGITVALLSGFGLLRYDPMVYEGIRGDIKTDAQVADIDGINYFFRLPIFLFCTFMLLAFYFFLDKLFGKKIALLGFVFIGLSPILLGISMIINPDSLLWIFLPLSLLSYLTFQKNTETKYLVFTGIFLGLSLLTKYVANILYVFFLFLPFLEYILADEKPELKGFLKKSFLQYFAIAGISMVTYYVLYPATWAHPNVLLEGTFGSKAFEKTWPIFAGLVALITIDVAFLEARIIGPILRFFSKYKQVLATALIAVLVGMILFTLVDTYLGMKPFDLEGILSSPKGVGTSEKGIPLAYASAMIANTYSLIFGLHPVLFLLFVVGLLTVVKRGTTMSLKTKTVIFFSLFILLYYLASTVNDVIATVRYQIILYPLALIIAAIGTAHVLSLDPVKRFLKPLPATLLLAVFLAGSLLYIRPFYFAYASPLLPARYLLNTKDMGDGSFEAATYLNALPNARNLVVWSDKGAVCTEFVGTCNIGFTKKDLLGKKYDYFVISIGRQSRSLKLSGAVNDIVDFKKVYSDATAFEHEVVIGGRPNNFVKIIPASAIAY